MHFCNTESKLESSLILQVKHSFFYMYLGEPQDIAVQWRTSPPLDGFWQKCQKPTWKQNKTEECKLMCLLISTEISSIQFVIWSSAAVNIPSRECFHHLSLWQAGEDLFPADDKGMSIPGNTDLLQTWEVSLVTVTVEPSILSSLLHVIINFKLQTISCLQSYLEGLTGSMVRC